jgi:hypothetical protein
VTLPLFVFHPQVSQVKSTLAMKNVLLEDGRWSEMVSGHVVRFADIIPLDL